MPGGERYGPASPVQINQWIQEGRVLQTTTLQDATTGQVLLARDLPSLVWTPQMQQPQPMVDPYSSSPYANPQANTPYPRPTNPYGPTPFTPTGLGMYNNTADKQANISMALSAGGVFLCCLCSPVGLYMAYQAKAMGARNGQTAVVVGWISVAIVFVAPALWFFLSLAQGR